RGDEGQHLPEEILIGALLKQLLHCHSVDGHGIRFLSVRVWEPEPTASRPMTSTSPMPLWTTWGKGITRRCSPVALRAPSAQRRRPASYTTSWDAPTRAACKAALVRSLIIFASRSATTLIICSTMRSAVGMSQ